jgi:hypothetical protein
LYPEVEEEDQEECQHLELILVLDSLSFFLEGGVGEEKFGVPVVLLRKRLSGESSDNDRLSVGLRVFSRITSGLGSRQERKLRSDLLRL